MDRGASRGSEAIPSGLTGDDMVHMPVLGVATSGCAILILFLKLDNFQACKLGMCLLTGKECHRCFWRVPGIVDAKELSDKDPARFQCRFEPGKDRGKLLLVYKRQGEMG